MTAWPVALASILLLSAANSFAAPQTVEAHKRFDVTVRLLQRECLELAVDKLIEARRVDADWKIEFRTGFGKDWLEKVTLTVHRKTADISEISIEALRAEGGVGSKAKPLPEATRNWTARILELVNRTDSTSPPK